VGAKIKAKPSSASIATGKFINKNKVVKSVL